MSDSLHMGTLSKDIWAGCRVSVSEGLKKSFYSGGLNTRLSFKKAQLKVKHPGPKNLVFAFAPGRGFKTLYFNLTLLWSNGGLPAICQAGLACGYEKQK